jgi:hypothetical protein
VLTMKLNRHGFRRTEIEPRIYARSKTNNPFPLNKPTRENRTLCAVLAPVAIDHRFLIGFMGMEPT